MLAASQDGATIAEIAAALYLSEGTVRNYLSSCIQKTGARNRDRGAARSPRNAAGCDGSAVVTAIAGSPPIR